MKSKNLWTAVAGLAAIGAGVGAALVYLKNKQPKEVVEEETEEEILEEECEATERTYTTLSEVVPVEEAKEAETTEDVTEEETTEEA